MNEAVKIMLERYHCRSIFDYENALKEIIQEIALLGLWRSKFFEKAAFYGGSALRILYGLDRFSEDLDFSLLRKDEGFSLLNYCRAIEDELGSFGFTVIVEKKSKTIESNIDSAFIKAGTMRNMISIDLPERVLQKIHSKKTIKIKLEIDIDPPLGFNVEAKYIFQPVPFSVNSYVLPDLFAGKMHAVLCRTWKNRVKGRDWYDLIWYTAKDVAVDLKHLENRMKQSGNLDKSSFLTEAKLKELLMQKIKVTDFNKAKEDVENLLKDSSSLTLWSKQYFEVICNRIIAV